MAGAQATHADLIVINGACPVYTPVCAPYGIFREALEILTGDVESAWTAGTVSREQAKRLWQLLPETIDKLLQIGPHLIDSLVSTESLLARGGSAALEPEKMEKLSAFHGRSTGGGSRLALARNEYRRAWQAGEALLEQLRRFGARAYLPETLDLLGEALLQLGRGEEARNHLHEGREEAKRTGARGHLWPILFRLSAMESDREEAQRLRQKAREIIEFIADHAADHAGEEYLRESFLALPEVQAVIQASR